MFARSVPLCVAILLIATVTPAQDAKKDLKELQGEWAVESVEPRIELDRPITLTIKGEQWTMRSPSILANGAAKTTLKVDQSKNPKTIDLTTMIGDGEPLPSRGIYKLEGNTFTVCRAIGKADRPTEFKGTDNHILIVFKREKK